MVTEHHMSDRHACALVGLSRATYRHVGQTSALNVELRDQVVHTSHTRKRWGYRIGVRVPLVAAMAVNQTWRMDFVSDAIAKPCAVSRRIKCKHAGNPSSQSPS